MVAHFVKLKVMSRHLLMSDVYNWPGNKPSKLTKQTGGNRYLLGLQRGHFALPENGFALLLPIGNNYNLHGDISHKFFMENRRSTLKFPKR